MFSKFESEEKGAKARHNKRINSDIEEHGDNKYMEHNKKWRQEDQEQQKVDEGHVL